MAVTMRIEGWGQRRGVLGYINRVGDASGRNSISVSDWMYLRTLGFGEETIERLMLGHISGILSQMVDYDFRCRVLKAQAKVGGSVKLIGLAVLRTPDASPFGSMEVAERYIREFPLGKDRYIEWFLRRTEGVREESLGAHGYLASIRECVGVVFAGKDGGKEHVEYEVDPRAVFGPGTLGRGYVEVIEEGGRIREELSSSEFLYRYMRWYFASKGFPAGGWKVPSTRKRVMEEIAQRGNIEFSWEMWKDSGEWARLLQRVLAGAGMTECLAFRILGELEHLFGTWGSRKRGRTRAPWNQPASDIRDGGLAPDGDYLVWEGECFGASMDEMKRTWRRVTATNDELYVLRICSRVPQEMGVVSSVLQKGWISGRNTLQSIHNYFLEEKRSSLYQETDETLSRIVRVLESYATNVSRMGENPERNSLNTLKNLKALDEMGVRNGISINKEGGLVWSGKRCFLGLNKTIIGGYKWEALGPAEEINQLDSDKIRWCWVEGLCRIKVGEAAWAKLSGVRRVMLMMRVIVGLGIGNPGRGDEGERWIRFLERVLKAVGSGFGGIEKFLRDSGPQEITMISQEGVGLVQMGGRWERFASSVASNAEGLSRMSTDSEKLLGSKVVSSWGMRIMAGYPMVGWGQSPDKTDYVEFGPWIKSMCYSPLIGGWASRWIRAGAMKMKLRRWFNVRGDSQTVTIVPDSDWDDCLWFLSRGVGLVPQVYYINEMGSDVDSLMRFPYYNGGDAGRVCTGGLIVPGGSGMASMTLAGMAWLKNRTTISVEMSQPGAASVGWEEKYVRSLRKEVVEGTKRNGSWSMEAMLARTITALETLGARIELINSEKDSKGKVQVVRKVVRATPFPKKENESLVWTWKDIEGVDVPGPDENLTAVLENLMWQEAVSVDGKTRTVQGLGRALPSSGILKEWGKNGSSKLGILYDELRVSSVYWGVYSGICACVDGRLEGGKKRMMVSSGIKQLPGMITPFRKVKQEGHPQIEWIKGEKFEPKL